MTTYVTVKLRLADLALTKGIVLTLAQISGDEAVLLGELLNIVGAHLTAENIMSISPEIRDSDIGKKEVDVGFPSHILAVMRHQLFAKVKAFTAGDIEQVIRIRQTIDAAIAAGSAAATERA